MQRVKSAVLASGLTALIAAAGCNKDRTQGGASGNTAAPVSAGQAAPESPYPALEVALRKVAKELSDKRCVLQSVPRCASYAEAVKLLDRKSKGLEALALLAPLLADADEAVATAAAWLFYDGGRRDIGRALYAVSSGRERARLEPKVVDTLITGLGKLDAGAATRVTTVAAWAASLSGKIDALTKVSDAHPSRSVSAAVITQLMRYGRLDALPKIQVYAKGENKAWADAALRAPLNMYRWTPEERAAICAWGQGFLGNADLKLAARAGHLMIRCREDEKYVDALLAEGQKRVAAGQWKMPFDFPFRDICFTGVLGRQKQPSQALCDKTYAFLESVVDNPKIDANMRARALDWIVYQRRDKKTRELLERYQKSKVPEIAKVATASIGMLERQLLKKKKKKNNRMMMKMKMKMKKKK